MIANKGSRYNYAQNYGDLALLVILDTYTLLRMPAKSLGSAESPVECMHVSKRGLARLEFVEDAT